MKKPLSFQFIVSGLFWLFLFFLLLQHSFSYLDPDLGWHLESGQRTYLSGQVTQTNDHNFSFPTNVWLDHEWLADLWLYRAYTVLGYPFINVFFSLLALLGLALLFYQVKDQKPQWPSFALLIIGAVAATPHFGVRIQEFTFLFTVIEFLLLLKYQKTLNWKWLIPIPLMIWLWAQLHAGFLLGILMLGLFGLVKIGELIWLKKDQQKKGLLTVIIIGLTSLGLTFINPYGLKLYGFLFGYRDTFYLTHIMEWLPQWDYPYEYWQLSYISILLIVLFTAIKNKLKNHNVFEVLLILFILATALKSRRNFPLLLAVSFPFLAIESIKALYPLGNKTKLHISKFLKICLIVPLIFLVINQVMSVKIIRNPFAEIKSTTLVNYPYQAVEWLKSQPELQGKRIFNDFGWGGYIIWQYPSAQIFMDGRQPQAKMTDVSGLEEYYRFYNDNQAESKLKEHNIELVFTKNDAEKTIEKASPWQKFLVFGYNTIEKQDARNELLDYLRQASNWNLIYQDKEALIYLRK